MPAQARPKRKTISKKAGLSDCPSAPASILQFGDLTLQVTAIVQTCSCAVQALEFASCSRLPVANEPISQDHLACQAGLSTLEATDRRCSLCGAEYCCTRYNRSTHGECFWQMQLSQAGSRASACRYILYVCRCAVLPCSAQYCARLSYACCQSKQLFTD